MGQERRHAADGADFAFDVVERDVAFGRGVKLQDLRDGEPVLEFLPNVGAQPVAAAQAKPVLLFAGLLWRIDQITAQLADILEQRAVPIDHVVPEFAGGEFIADHHRSAAHQHRAGGNDAADAVIQRQAIVHAVVGTGVHEAGEPKAPLHQPVMADMGGLRQAGRAGGVDVERAVGDGHAAAFGSGQPSAGQLFDGTIDAGKIRRCRATRFLAGPP